MIRSARLIKGDERLEADVCVVGAGPAGITLTQRLIHSGLKVVLLEAGPFDPDLENQRMADGELTGLPYSLQNARARAFGGTAHFWNINLGGGSPGLRLRRLDDSDFRPREWIPYSGWPLDLHDLIPYYEQAEAFFGIDGQGYRLPSHSSETDRLVDDAGELEGTVFRFGRASSVLDQRQVMADDDSVDVVVGAVAVRLERDRTGDISRIHAMSLTGNDFAVEASAYVLAAGGIENARLLLLNGLDRQSKDGEQGLVGRFFMEHPHTRAGFVIPSGGGPGSIAPGIQDIGGAPGEPWFRLVDETASMHRTGNVVFSLTPVTASEMRRAIGSSPQTPAVRAARDMVSYLFGDSSKDVDIPRMLKTAVRAPMEIVGAALTKANWALKERARSMFTADDDVVYRVDVMAEQFPHPESKVSLSASLDPIGLQRPVLNWRIDDLNMSSLRRAYDVFGQQVTRTGFGEFVPSLDTENVPVSGGYHHMGTTRMHPEETQGVVDTQGRVHGTPNLYACGSSVFPTSGVSNPTLTIVALSFRLADHLVHCL